MVGTSWSGSAPELQALAEGIFVGEKSVDHRCVDHHDRGRLFVVRVGKKSALQERHAQCLEIIRRDGAVAGGDKLVRRFRRTPRDIEMDDRSRRRSPEETMPQRPSERREASWRARRDDRKTDSDPRGFA